MLFFKNDLFIYGCAASVAVCGLSLVMAGRGYSSWRSLGFSLQWLLLLQNMSSVVGMHGLSCFAACGIFLNQGLNPCSPALAGRFLSTGPLGKSQDDAFPINVVLIFKLPYILRA